MKRLMGGICLMLCSVLAVGSFTAVAESEDMYDYTYPYDAVTENVGLNSVELLSLIGVNLTDTEKKYLSQDSSSVFSYYSKIPSSSPNIKAVLYNNDDSLYLQAQDFTYQTASGETVTWSPYSAEGVLFTSNDDENYVNLSDAPDDRDYAKIEYRATVNLSNGYINELMNSTYLTAKAYSDEKDKQDEIYNTAYAKYLEEYRQYQTYLSDLEKYNSDLQKYQEYQKALSVWQEEQSEYSQYLEKLDQYEQQYALYTQYLSDRKSYEDSLAEYNAYLVALEKYEKEYAEYYSSDAYSDLLKAKSQLDILSFITTPVTSKNRTLKNAILGGKVTSVLNEKDTLVNDLGADEKAVERAETSTKILRSLISGYLECKTDEEKYSFYIINYSSLVTNFEELLRSLDYLYTSNNSVRLAIQNKGKEEEYLILIAELFVISNALDNNPIGNYQSLYKKYDTKNVKTYDENWTIKGKTPLEILENIEYLVDTNDATPLENGYPQLSEEPTKPTEVAKPVEPVKVKEPTKPTEVAKPSDPPTEVVEPTPPQEVATPSAEPTPYVVDDDTALLIEEYKSGKLCFREPFTDSIEVTLSATVYKQFRNVNTIGLYFCDNQGELLWETETETYSSVVYGGTIPQVSKVGYICTFDYWVDEEGNRFDLQNISGDRSDVYLFPHYLETPIKYAVNWVVGDSTETTFVAYMQTPEYYGTPTLPNDGDREYRFTSWDKQIVAVEGEQTYTAQFEESILITFSVEGVNYIQSLWYGDMPVFELTPQKADDNQYFYVFEGWDSAVSVATADTCYTAVFKAYSLVNSSDGSNITVESTAKSYIVNAENSTEKIEIETILQKAKDGGKSLNINFADTNISLTNSNVRTLVESNVSSLSVDVKSLGEYSYTFEVSLHGKTRATLADCTFTFTAKGYFNENYSYLYAGDTLVPFTISGDTITFTASPNTTYTLKAQYEVHIVASSDIEISTDKTLYECGDSVSLTFGEISEGMELTKVTVIDSNGNEIELSDNTFTMPSAEVTVTVTCSYKQFLITFIVNGKTISSKLYTYGDIVDLPFDPVLADDEEYTYTFVGWSDDDSIVSSDTSLSVSDEKHYVAVFEQETLPEEESSGWTDLKIAITIFKVALVLIFIVTPITVAIVIFVLKFKRKR